MGKGHARVRSAPPVTARGAPGANGGQSYGAMKNPGHGARGLVR